MILIILNNSITYLEKSLIVYEEEIEYSIKKSIHINF